VRIQKIENIYSHRLKSAIGVLVSMHSIRMMHSGIALLVLTFQARFPGIQDSAPCSLGRAGRSGLVVWARAVRAIRAGRAGPVGRLRDLGGGAEAPILTRTPPGGRPRRHRHPSRRTRSPRGRCVGPDRAARQAVQGLPLPARRVPGRRESTLRPVLAPVSAAAAARCAAGHRQGRSGQGRLGPGPRSFAGEEGALSLTARGPHCPVRVDRAKRSLSPSARCPSESPPPSGSVAHRLRPRPLKPEPEWLIPHRHPPSESPP
jgi:hypothetical protein